MFSRLDVRLPNDLIGIVDLIRTKQGLTRTAFIRAAIERHVENYRADNNLPPAKAGDFIEAFRQDYVGRVDDDTDEAIRALLNP